MFQSHDHRDICGAIHSRSPNARHHTRHTTVLTTLLIIADHITSQITRHIAGLARSLVSSLDLAWNDCANNAKLADPYLMQTVHSATGTRTRVARVRAEYPDQLDYSGV